LRFKDFKANGDWVLFFKKTYKDKEINWDEKMDILSRYISRNPDGEPGDKIMSERTVRNWAKALDLVELNSPPPEQYEIAQERVIPKDTKRFLITWAQNNTPIHKKFLENMEAYSEHIGAEILVIAGRYKNPTSIFSKEQNEEEFWDKSVVQYLDANRHSLNGYVTVLSDLKIQPTAINPLSSLAGLSGKESTIFGHPKQQLEVIPTLEGYREKIMMTTGSVSLPNYTDSKSGKKGEFNHIIGCLVVELDGEDSFMRHISADDDGSFSDLKFRVKNRKVTDNNGIDGIVLGDIHLGQDNDVIMESTFNIIKDFNAPKVVLHDLFDAYSVNVHETKNPFLQYQKELADRNDLKKEVDAMLAWLGDLKEITDEIIIVKSNHDDMIDRYLTNEDWKRGHIKNALTYMQYSTAILTGEAENGIIPWVINQTYPSVITLDLDSSYRINGWEIAIHGHQGSNGSRGSKNVFRKLSTKLITAHTHSPHLADGAACVGCTCKKKQGYNKGGASSWLYSHVIIHKDYNNSGSSKIQHLVINDQGRYTTLF